LTAIANLASPATLAARLIAATIGGFRRVLLGIFVIPTVFTLTAATTAAIGLIALLSTRPARMRLSRHDDAVIVLGVLEIAFRRDYVAGGERVARQRHVFLCDM